ncbi:hypothetical protein ABIC27_000847 [Streptomyces sp. PvR034]
MLGHAIDGTQAEYVRVPFADLSVHPLPSAVDSHDAVLLADIFPTSYEVGVLNGSVQPGDTVVVVGAGPIGLAAIATAGLYSPAVDRRCRPRGLEAGGGPRTRRGHNPAQGPRPVAAATSPSTRPPYLAPR